MGQATDPECIAWGAVRSGSMEMHRRSFDGFKRMICGLIVRCLACLTNLCGLVTYSQAPRDVAKPPASSVLGIRTAS